MVKFIDKGCHPNIEYIAKSVNFEYFIVVEAVSLWEAKNILKFKVDFALQSPN